MIENSCTCCGKTIEDANETECAICKKWWEDNKLIDMGLSDD